MITLSRSISQISQGDPTQYEIRLHYCHHHCHHDHHHHSHHSDLSNHHNINTKTMDPNPETKPIRKATTRPAKNSAHHHS